jgi:hypothetical protein
MEPCLNCPDKEVDEYGYLCDIACGKRTAWINFTAGRQQAFKEVGEKIIILEKWGQINVKGFPLVTALVELLEQGKLE